MVDSFVVWIHKLTQQTGLNLYFQEITAVQKVFCTNNCITRNVEILLFNLKTTWMILAKEVVGIGI